jgi:hypothetical protein
MTRRLIISVAAIALGVVTMTTGALAQQKPLKDQIVGTWSLLLVDNMRADGTRVPAYGPNPKGAVIFTADGHYSLQIMRDVRPKFASNNREAGNPDEYKAAVHGMISHFGTYSINEADKTLNLRIAGSSFPNWDETSQKRTITALVGDDLTWTNPTPSTAPAGNVRSELAWRRVK